MYCYNTSYTETPALYNDLHIDYNLLHLWGCIGESEGDRGILIDLQLQRRCVFIDAPSFIYLFYLFIQHFYSALFINKYALMRYA